MKSAALMWWVVMLGATVAAGCGDGGRTSLDLGDDAGALPDQARACSANADCDDGLFCNGSETCVAFACVPGTAFVCPNDGIACTLERCSEDTRACRSSAPDADGDGHADASCLDLSGNPIGDDCDDNDINRFPSNFEVCDVENRDEDCDESTFGPIDGSIDRDDDGFPDARCCNERAAGGMNCGTDCNDVRSEIRPGATEACDGLDNNCNTVADEGVALAGFVDADFDGIGGSVPMSSCGGVAGFSTESGDCDDNNPAVFPNAPELCDSVNNDCDSATDETVDSADWYVDADGDGFGDRNTPAISSCFIQPGLSLLGTDCNDAVASINPAAAELCDGVDNDCNGRLDFQIAVNNFEDDDRDGRVDFACPILGTDCDDQDPATGRGSAETCDGRDNDCDERVDEGAEDRQWFRDNDLDGYGSPVSGSVLSCQPPLGFSIRAGDCNDSNPARSPDASETCNAVDDDCDSAIDEAPGMMCPMGSGGESGICVAGTCTLACATGRANCDGMPTNGCEVNTRSNRSHCGGCNFFCADGASGTGACFDSACGFACNAGFADCNAGSGCETPVLADASNCGDCGVTCGAAGSCQSGFCDGALQLAVSDDFACMSRENGALVCWGSNTFFRVGVDGPPTAVTLQTPLPVWFQSFDLVDVAVGRNHSCGLTALGTVWCWGRNNQQQLGNAGPDTPTPAAVALPTAMVDISVGDSHSCAVGQDTRVYCWGGDTNSQLGNSSVSTSSATAVNVETAPSVPLVGAVSIASTSRYTCVVTASGGVMCWGSLSLLTVSLAAAPLGSTTWTDVQELATGREFACLRRRSDGGSTYCWGDNTYRTVSDSSFVTVYADPTRVPGVTNPLELYAGNDLLCVRNPTGVFCRGRNDGGRLGTQNNSALVDRFETVIGGRIITEFADGGPRAGPICGFTAGGDVYCWGDNSSGVIDPLGGAIILAPTRIQGLTRTAP